MKKIIVGGVQFSMPSMPFIGLGSARQLCETLTSSKVRC